MEESQKYHALAKDSGNRLKAYVLSVSSGGTGVFFVVLTKEAVLKLSVFEKTTLIVALISFLITVGLSLYELRVDARRFYALAKELEKPKSEQNWNQIEQYKSIRMRLINASYLTLGIAILSLGVYLVAKIWSS